MASTPQRERIPFVGRRNELERLAHHRSRLEGNHERGRRLILIEGFSGVGKTALAEEFLATLEREEMSFTPRGAYSPHLRRPVLSPLFDALDDLFSNRFAQQRLLSLFTDTTYHALLPRLPMVSSIVGFDTPDALLEKTNPSAQAVLLAAVLAHAARFRPVVLLLDDVQWMPAEDLEALATLSSSLRNAPVLILATLRREAPEADAIRRALQPVVLDQFYVRPLTNQEVAELLTELYDARVSARLAADIARAGDGLPMRVIELVGMLESQGVLTIGVKGRWQLGTGYHPALLQREGSSADRVRRLGTDERQVLLLLGCAGGQATRNELAEWFGLMHESSTADGAAPETTASDPSAPDTARRATITEMLAGLEATRMIKPVFSNPDKVTFVHESILEALRQLRTRDDLVAVVRLIIGRKELRREAYRWTHDEELFQVLLEMLLREDSPERAEMIDRMIGSIDMYTVQWDREHRNRVYDTLMANRSRLTVREYARTLVQVIRWYHVFTQFNQALVLAEELYGIVQSEPCGPDIHAEACTSLALTKVYIDRSADVEGLLQEGWNALGRIDDPTVRLKIELEIAKMRAAMVPVSEPREAINQMRRVMQLSEQLGIDDGKHFVLPDLVVRSARMRDEEGLRYIYHDILGSIRANASGSPLPPFLVISSVVRAALINGDIFMARTIFESWSQCSAPLAITDYVAYSYLTTLFAYADGEPSLAADVAINAREEVLRYRTTSKQFSWELVFGHMVLQIQLLPALVAAGRLVEALGLAETMLVELQLAENALPDMAFVMEVYRTWLRWRCLLPAEAPINLSWPGPNFASEGGRAARRVAYDPATAARAGDAFRTLYAEQIVSAPPQMRYIGEMLLATLECAENNHAEALAAIERATGTCAQLYDWQKELEYRSAGITVRLRWAQAEPDRSDELVEESLERARALFTRLSEKGLVARISQLTELFRDEAHAITTATHRDLPAQFDKLGAQAQAAAHVVLRNSRSQESGPIDRARLFIMGPLRLMRPHSYMELSDTAFGREGARTLLTALVAAQVLNRPPTREELALRVAPKARTQEQQKKSLYNAASSARAACASANSIHSVGANSLELNTNPELEGSVWVDALEILHAVEIAREQELEGKNGTAFDAYQRALLLARKGDFASDLYADWVDAARERLRQVVRQAALSVGRIALHSGWYAAGIEAISAQLTRDPYDEQAHRVLIRLYSESGNRSAALKQLEKCRKLIKREFGVEPEPETLRLRKEIVAAGADDSVPLPRR